MVKTEDYIRQTVVIFFAQKRIIFLVFLIITLLTLAISFLWPPTYAAIGSILVKGKQIEKSPETLENTQIRMFEISPEDLASEQEIITNPEVVENTIKDLRDKKIAFTDVPNTEADTTKAVSKIQSKLTTRRLPDSYVIEISYKNNDSGRAVTVLNSLMDQYIDYRRNLFAPAQAVQFYQNQVKRFNDGLREIENKEIDLAQLVRSADPTREITNNFVQQSDLESQLNGIRSRYIEKSEYVKYLRKMLKNKNINFFSAIDNLPIAQLGAKLQDKYIEYRNMLQVYLPNSERAASFHDQLMATYNTLEGEVRAYTSQQKNAADTLFEQVTAMENRLEELSSRNIDLHSAMIELQRIQREKELFSHSYGTFAKRLEESRINSTSDANNLFTISVLHRPFSSGDPIFPNPRTLIPLGMLIGLIAGCLLGFIREYFDHTFKTPEDAAKFAGIPTLFSIPRWE